MFDDTRKNLVEGKRIEPCVFCMRKPQFVQWEGRALVIFKHDCKFVKHESICFPAKADEAISEWNLAIGSARANAIRSQQHNNEQQLTAINDLLSAAKPALTLMKNFFVSKNGAGTIKMLEKAINRVEGFKE